MAYATLVSTTELEQHLTDPDWVVLDCRFYLDDPERGRKDYDQNHIPGACHVHLDRDLSGPIIPGVTGRHPLPEIGSFSERISRWGIDDKAQVVAYDAMGGAFAARLWWLLHWLGHDAAAVLDGGWQTWEREKRPVTSGRAESRPARVFKPSPRPHLVAGAEEILEKRFDSEYLILDARGADRYRGENETIDPVAGHIPGALSAPFTENLDETGHFLEAQRLRERFQLLLEGVPAKHAVVYCGSGVTAAHNLLAMKHAGLGDARLYPGSWSEWITDSERPVIQGPSVFGEDP